MTKNYNFSQWTDYFISNKKNLRHIEWSDLYKLSEDEYETIFDSIRIFQRGESSEAKHIFKQAEEFLVNRSDHSYMEALTLFINEEHRHAFELKRFMSLQDIPRLREHWTDSIFRWLRRLGKLEQSISVLLTAEIIASVYYKALMNSTKSKTLRQICEQILFDEDMHIRFQAEAISQFYVNRFPMSNKIVTYAKLFLLEGTICVVWNDHRKVLKAGRYDFFLFRKECLQQFRMCDLIIHKDKVITAGKVVLQPVVSKIIK